LVRETILLFILEQAVHNLFVINLKKKNLKNFNETYIAMLDLTVKSTPITGHAGPEGSRRVKAPRFLDIGTIWW
jgi:hypothetical protein